MSKKELKITIEALTSCAANCSGCFLTPEMRSASNLWSVEKRAKAGRFIRDFISYHEAQSPIDEIGLNFGQGDYLQLNEASINDLMSDILSWTESKACLFLTASGVTNRVRLKNSVDLFHQLSIKNKHPLLFDLVIDSSKLTGNFIHIYEENIAYMRQVFGYVDLNMNMGLDVVNFITPENFSNLLLKNSVEFITLNFVPAKHMNLKVDDFKKILSWVDSFSRVSKELPYKVNFHQTFFINHSISSGMNIFELNDLLNKTYCHEVFIDYDGNLFIQHEGIGDTPLTSRSGYSAVCNIFDEYNSIDGIISKINEYGTKLNKAMVKEFNSAQSCSGCEFKNTCMKSGVQSMKNVIGFDKKQEKCYLGLDDFLRFILNSPNQKVLLSEFSGVYHQKDLDKNEVKMKLQKMKFKNNFSF